MRRFSCLTGVFRFSYPDLLCKVCILKIQEKNTESIKEAASAVGSISTDELDIRFNPDIFSSTVDTIAEEGEIRRQKQLIVDVASFLVNEQIPAFVKECKEGSENCLDCVSMVNNLHHKVRYFSPSRESYQLVVHLNIAS